MSAFAAVKKSSSLFAAAFAASLSFSASAFALDSENFISAVQDGISLYGMSLEYSGRPQPEGDTISLQNARLLLRKDKTAPAVPILLGALRFEHIKPAADGSFNVENIIAGRSLPPMAAGDQAAHKAGQIIIRNMQIAGAHISPKGKIYTIDQYLPYEKVAVENITYQVDGRAVMSLNGLGAQYIKKSGGIYQNISQIASFTYDPAALPGKDGQDAKKMLASFGYSSIKGSFSASADWNPQTTDLTIGAYKISFDNAGSLSLSGKLSGVSQDFANAYQKLALRQMEEPAPTDLQTQQMNQEAVNLAGLLNINALQLTYQDNSLAGRILDYLSQNAAQPRAELVSMLKAGILANTVNFQNKEFAAAAAEQINMFLDKPQSLQIAVKPQNPVALSSVLLALSISPEQLITILGLNISANQ